MSNLTKTIVVLLLVGCSDSVGTSADVGEDIAADVRDMSNQRDVRLDTNDVGQDVTDMWTDVRDASSDMQADLDMGLVIPELPQLGFGDAVRAFRGTGMFSVMSDGKIQAIGGGNGQRVGVTLPNADAPVSPEAWTGLADAQLVWAALREHKFVLGHPFFWVFNPDWSLASSGVVEDCTGTFGSVPFEEGFVFLHCRSPSPHKLIDLRDPTSPLQRELPIDTDRIFAFKNIEGTVFGLQITEDGIAGIAVDGSGTFSTLPLEEKANVNARTILSGDIVWTFVSSQAETKIQRTDLVTRQSRVFDFPTVGDGLASFVFQYYEVMGEKIYAGVSGDPGGADPLTLFLVAIDLSDPDNPKVSQRMPMQRLPTWMDATDEVLYVNRFNTPPGESPIQKINVSEFVFD